MHSALENIRDATLGTSFEGNLWLVGGAVRDELMGVEHKNDFDIVTQGSSSELAALLFEKGASSIVPVTYERFGTAMVHVGGVNIELVTARRESYNPDSRKPNVTPASLEEDAARRDFTCNTLMRNIHSEELRDPLGNGLADLRAKVLRTPRDPAATFHDDPLRMLRAVRFRWQLGFEPVEGLYESIKAERERLRIISAERVRDELVKMMLRPTGPDALHDLMELGLIAIFAPEFGPMVGCEQGRHHHLDVWNHTLLVMRNAGPDDLIVTLAALLHDIGKPSTRNIDAKGDTRFFGHEAIGADLARSVLRNLRFSEKDIHAVVKLVKNHMRLGSFPEFTPAAGRRLLRDLGDELPRLLALVEADCEGLKPGVRRLDLQPVRDRIEEIRRATPPETLESPLSGEEIMAALGIPGGPEVGRWKTLLTEKVLEGELSPDDREGAVRILRGGLDT